MAIYESIKSLEIWSSMVFNLFFCDNTILSCFFFFLYNWFIHFICNAVVAQIFVPTAELVIPTEIATNVENAKIETKPVTAEAKISKCST